MSNEFWLGFIYGGLTTAIPLLGYMAWDANRRAQERLRQLSRLPKPRVTAEWIKAAGERAMQSMRERGDLPVVSYADVQRDTTAGVKGPEHG